MDATTILKPLGFGTALDAALNILGVIAEMEAGRQFDAVCLETLKRVHDQLCEAKRRFREAEAERISN